MALAAKIPFRHPYAAGFPGLGSQPMPTDADALDYLDRMAAADGASVETGVAVAVDAFFRDLKATPGLFDAIKASCILCGARTITGALVPLAGDAPTAQGGWAAGDYSRTAGMTGDGNALYLDSNRTNDADPQNDKHMSAYITASPAFVADNLIASISRFPTSQTQILRTTSDVGGGVNSSDRVELVYGGELGLFATTRSGASLSMYFDGDSATETKVSNGHHSYTTYVFARNDEGTVDNFSTATIAFYSIGTNISVTDLADLDTAVTNLITAIGEAL